MKSFIDNEENITKELSLDKIYNFPQNVAIKKHKNKVLVISPFGASWLVISEKELEVFKFLLEGNTVGSALEKFDEDIVIRLVTQIEAKKFDNFKLRKNNDINMYIYLTNNCNLRCKHCYMYSGDIIIEELDVSIWKKVIKEFADNGGSGITFTGGEVLLYEHFFDLIKYSHELGIKNTILSNGVLWNEETIYRNNCFIDEIQLSLDGYDRESYYRVRQFDGFEKVIDTITLFLKYDINVSVAVTPIFDDIDKFILEFEKFAKKFIKENNVIIKINLELLEGREINLTEKENREYRVKLRKLVQRLYPSFYETAFVLNYKDSNCKENCGFGGITIAANGDVYWCNQIFKLTSKYNIKNMSMKEIIELSKEMKNKTSVDNLLTCKDCEVKYICSGGCRLKIADIENADTHNGLWNNKCNVEHKNDILNKMINYNEYFYL